jgi:hypothetical protein
MTNGQKEESEQRTGLISRDCVQLRVLPQLEMEKAFIR